MVLSFTSMDHATAALTFDLTIEKHQFHPSVLEVPTGEKIILIVHNNDTTTEEFESHDLHREKIILGKSKAKIILGSLKPGTYHYFGEFHQSTAQGSIVAK